MPKPNKLKVRVAPTVTIGRDEYRNLICAAVRLEIIQKAYLYSSGFETDLILQSIFGDRNLGGAG